MQPQSEVNKGRKTLVLDLDETLVHSTFQKVSDSDYIIPVEIEGNIYSVYVYLRPGALEFIKKMSEIYEVIIYTASLSIVGCFPVSLISSMLIHYLIEWMRISIFLLVYLEIIVLCLKECM